MNSISKLDEFINAYNTTSYTNVQEIENKKYFPIFKNSSYAKVPREYYIEVPYDDDTKTKQEITPAPKEIKLSNYNIRDYSKFLGNKLNVKYDIYPSGVDKLNIEFNNLDNDIYFQYKIGDYTSDYIKIDRRVYTITYDYRKNFEIYITNGVNYKNEKISPSTLRKTLSIVDGKVYYLNSSILYSEDKIITGSFVNLYDDNVLTNDGKIYNIKTKKETSANIDYNILNNSEPIYSTRYNGQTIKTYYNYSLVDSSKRISIICKKW